MTKRRIDDDSVEDGFTNMSLEASTSRIMDVTESTPESSNHGLFDGLGGCYFWSSSIRIQNRILKIALAETRSKKRNRRGYKKKKKAYATVHSSFESPATDFSELDAQLRGVGGHANDDRC